MRPNSILLKSRATSSQPNDAQRDVCKKNVNDAVSEHRDSSHMNEGKYNRAPLKFYDIYIEGIMAPTEGCYVNERASEGLARIGVRVAEDVREVGKWKNEKKRKQEAAEEAAEQVDDREANPFSSSQSWHLWGEEFSNETVKIEDTKEPPNAGHRASVADRLLAAWTTVVSVIYDGDGGVADLRISG